MPSFLITLQEYMIMKESINVLDLLDRDTYQKTTISVIREVLI